MEGKTSIGAARSIMGKNFIGPDELSKISSRLGIKDLRNTDYVVPQIPYSLDLLKKCSNDYILILGISDSVDGNPLTINQMRSFFGTDPNFCEPCFYNQDWYIDEEFAKNNVLPFEWYLLSVRIVEDSRGIEPEVYMKRCLNNDLPFAVLCTFTFFAFYFLNDGEVLWSHDYVWCKDRDHNNDQIYVGRYFDPNKINKNGFSIHRHLSLNNTYGISFIVNN